ncbi:MAG: penicillin acylase family protein, partial [Pseudomonadota bacterium]|nr:penicillin acylase family protein [Pseudomonadota bacterium]
MDRRDIQATGRNAVLYCLLAATLAGCDASSPEAAPPAPQASESLPGAGEDAGKTVVYRDTYGVPHIYAPTVEAGLYAQGWTQAEDRPEQLLMNLKLAMGEFTEVAGEEGVQIS